MRSWVAIVTLGCALGCGGRSSSQQSTESIEALIERVASATAVDESAERLAATGDVRAIEPLGELWRRGGRVDPSALELMISVAERQDWKPAIPFLVQALTGADLRQPASVRGALLAASALGRSRDEQARAALLGMAETAYPGPEARRIRRAVIDALVGFGQDEAVRAALMRLLARAKGGGLGEARAAAMAVGGGRDRDSVVPLVQAALATPALEPAVRVAIAAIGDRAVANLRLAIRDEHRRIKQTAAELGLDKDCGKTPTDRPSTCKAPARVRRLSARLLGDVRASTAIGDIARLLRQQPIATAAAPEADDDDGTVGEPGPSHHRAALLALRDIGDSTAAEAVKDYWQKPADETLRPLAFAVYSELASDTRVLAELAALFKEEPGGATGLAAALAYSRLVREREQIAPLVEALARFRRDGDRDTAKTYAGFVTRAETGVDCVYEPRCYEAAVRSGSAAKRDRALLELAKLGPAASKSALTLIWALQDPDPEVVGLAGRALVRVARAPCDECAEALRQILVTVDPDDFSASVLPIRIALARLRRYPKPKPEPSAKAEPTDAVKPEESKPKASKPAESKPKASKPVEAKKSKSKSKKPKKPKASKPAESKPKSKPKA